MGIEPKTAWILSHPRRRTVSDTTFYALYTVQDATDQRVEAVKDPPVNNGHVILGIEYDEESTHYVVQGTT